MPHYKSTTGEIHYLDDSSYAYMLPPGSVQITAEEAAIAEGKTAEALAAARRAANIDALWQAATDYEQERISGSAVGILTLGVLTNKPKSRKVQAWLGAIWRLYYQRKATVTDAPLDPALLDFSSCGAIPHSVPELMEEVGT